MEGAEERGPPRRRRGRELRFICETRTHPSAKAEAEAATKRGSERREREERERERWAVGEWRLGGPRHGAWRSFAIAARSFTLSPKRLFKAACLPVSLPATHSL